MQINIDVMISTLKLTRSGAVSHISVKRDSCVPGDIVRRMLKKMQKQELVYVEDGNVNIDSLQRLKLAVCALKAGADIERVSRHLSWKEFEDMAAAILEQHGYDTLENFRLKHSGRKWEVDVIGIKEPLIVCIDCKHWSSGPHKSTLRRMVEEQVKRTFALADSIPSLKSKIHVSLSKSVILLPAILSLGICRLKFFDNVPVVPILKLQDFLNQLPAHVKTLKRLRVKIME